MGSKRTFRFWTTRVLESQRFSFAVARWHNDCSGASIDETTIGAGAMDVDAIKAAISEASAEPKMASANAKIAEFARFGSPYVPSSALLRSDNLQKVLREQPEFAGNLMFSMAGNGWLSAAMMIPETLLTKAESEGANKAIDWLLGVLAMRKATALSILPIWGLEIQQTVVLRGDLRLVPVSELPDSPTLRSILNRTPTLSGSPIRWFPPDAALTITSLVEPLWVVEAGTGQVAPFDAGTTELLHDVRKLLALSGPVRLDSFEEWTQFLNDDLFRLTSSPIMLRAAEIQPRSLEPLGTFDGDAAKAAVNSYIEMSNPPKPVVRMAIDRFDRALRRHDPGDAAVEMSTALESLLGDGSGELVWKVGLRASIIAGGNLERRKRVRAVVHALYALRSAVVHTGLTPKDSKVKGGPSMPANDLVKEGFGVVSEILRSALAMKTMPDWFEAEVAGGLNSGVTKAARETEASPDTPDTGEASCI
jgi:hypothetical protein